MADVIKKAVVDSSLLTTLDWEADGYIVRYRIKSENKNLSSHWSPVYIIPVDSFPQVLGNYYEVLNQEGEPDERTTVTVTWEDLVDRPLYDVFVSFRGATVSNTFEYDSDDFIYHGTTSVHNYTFIKEDETTSLRIVVQPAADKKLIKQNFVIYDSDPQNAVYES